MRLGIRSYIRLARPYERADPGANPHLRRTFQMKRFAFVAAALLLVAGTKLHAQTATKDSTKKAAATAKSAAKTADKAAASAQQSAKSAEKSASAAKTEAKTADKAASTAEKAATGTAPKKSSGKKGGKKSAAKKDTTATKKP